MILIVAMLLSEPSVLPLTSKDVKLGGAEVFTSRARRQRLHVHLDSRGSVLGAPQLSSSLVNDRLEIAWVLVNSSVGSLVSVHAFFFFFWRCKMSPNDRMWVSTCICNYKVSTTNNGSL